MSAGLLTLILGGVRSGKSAYALRLAARSGAAVTVVATARAGDPEMRRRIDLHRRGRPKSWTTIESPIEVASALRLSGPHATVLLDDVGNLIANHLTELAPALAADAATAPPDLEQALEVRVADELSGLGALVADGRIAHAIVVTNETGMGVVPPTVLGRLFRDALGRANQTLAASADSVVFCVAGLPTVLKGQDPMKAAG
ncbi:MAG: bifunctional adenosylcobinamide kinase/adenosylcobinamide-phosphate guanylyltransferase [Actinobacteria bacterium]|nr:bifunctional adenosylcobinamide kinase/adenosylcobinamide-phosphate guanylyltransferase [Actinomycetota bacterium]